MLEAANWTAARPGFAGLRAQPGQFDFRQAKVSQAFCC